MSKSRIHTSPFFDLQHGLCISQERGIFIWFMKDHFWKVRSDGSLLAIVHKRRASEVLLRLLESVEETRHANA